MLFRSRLQQPARRRYVRRQPSHSDHHAQRVGQRRATCDDDAHSLSRRCGCICGKSPGQQQHLCRRLARRSRCAVWRAPKRSPPAAIPESPNATAASSYGRPAALRMRFDCMRRRLELIHLRHTTRHDRYSSDRERNLDSGTGNGIARIDGNGSVSRFSAVFAHAGEGRPSAGVSLMTEQVSASVKKL